MHYVGAILDALAPLHVSMVLVCEQGIRQTAEFATHLARVQCGFEIDDGVPPSWGQPAYTVGALRFLALRRAIARHKPDHVYIPYADGLIQVAGLARMVGFSLSRPGMEIEALMMRGKFAYEPLPASLRTRLIATALARTPVDIVHHIDPIVYDYVRHQFESLAVRFRLLPEAVESIVPLDLRTARLRLGISPLGKYVGCLGALSAGKGVAFLLKAFSSTAMEADHRLLLVGKPDPELRRLLAGDYRTLQEAGRIVHIDRYVSQDEFHLGLMASDVVCAPYHRQIGSSGVVVRAATIGRPLLGSDFGWVGRVIRDFELGIVCDVTDVPRFGTELARALALSAGYRPGPKARLFSNYHQQENFEWHWTRRLRERMGLGTRRASSEWAWPESPSFDQALHA